MLELINFVDYVIGVYMWILIAAAIVSWLFAFNVLDTRNRLIYTVGDVLYRVTEPALRPIRRVAPNLGGVDISFIILYFGLIFVQFVVLGNLRKLFY